MKKVRLRFLFSLVTIIVLVFVLSRQLFDIVPPLGKILDPFSGFVQNENDGMLEAPQLVINKAGLHDSVSVFFDNRKVPHIYANNPEDLYYAQGYVTAGLRLWQMDFLSYASGGRLSEIFGARFLDYDRNQRRIGLLDAAKASLKLIEENSETGKIVTAYTNGVNAYIKQLHYKNMPLEYKIFDYQPEPWSNLKTVLVMKYMAAMLCGYEEDAVMSRMLLALGDDKFNRFFPDFPGHMAAALNDSVPMTDTPRTWVRKPVYLDSSFLSMNSAVSKSPYNPTAGSNSWAVSGRKTKSGFPILCSDPHLPLSLPAIWVEMQLVTPGINVYGASIPGIPAVIIGFNENIAWGTTNGCDDTKDWYKLKIDNNYKKYELDGKWNELHTTIEEFKIKGQPAFFDTIYHTIQGPVVNDKKFPGANSTFLNYALNWGLHQPSNELLTFLKLAQAKNYTDFREALKNYSSPVQSFTFISKNNDIAIYHQGRIAVKSQGQGKFILDGTSSEYLYTRYIPADSLPHLYNPTCNYVIAANQHPANAHYSYYINGYYKQTRAKRIKQILGSEDDFDIEKMQSMQLDNINTFAADALPVFINNINKGPLTGEEKKLLEWLNTWKSTYDFNDEKATLFELWRKNIRNYTWDEFKNFSFGAKIPDDYILLDLIRNEPGNDYFDRQNSPAKENAGTIIQQAFDSATIEFARMKTTGSRKWGEKNKINIRNLANISLFSRNNIPSAGCFEAINAMANNTGPSWRMVVELGPRPKAFGIYPAGQSGNGMSRYADNFIDDWNKGHYYPLLFFMSTQEARSNATAEWIFK